jgi:alcohol dehydrogenase
MTTASAPRPADTRLDPRYLETEVFTVTVPMRIMYGRGASSEVTAQLQRGQLERVLVITDANLRAAGVGDELIEGLKRHGSPIIHERVPGEPMISEIDETVAAARRAEPTAVVAIGGGATMDTAKCVRLLLEHEGEVRDYIGMDRFAVTHSEIPLVLVATTAGTGAECVAAALMIDDHTREKVMVALWAMNAEIAVVDPDLTVTVPSGPTAATGSDALAQAIGPFIGPRRQPVADALASEAIRLLTAYLPRAVRDGNDLEARAAVAYGSVMSGLAMRNTEAMGDQFFDEVLGPKYGIPHGTVAGIVLPYVLQFNRAQAAPQIARMARLIVAEPAASEGERVDQVITRLHAFVEEICLPRLEDHGVAARDLPVLARDVSEHFGVPMGINPGLITEDVALKILEGAFNRADPLDIEF